MAKPPITSRVMARAGAQAERGQPMNLSMAPAPAPALPERAGVLSQRLQNIALWYISARQRGGEALLEMARWLSEARQEAKHGEWQTFLDATGTTPNHAESLLGVHARALIDPVFADAMRRNFLSLSAGYELLSAPPEAQDRLLERKEKIPRKQIREEKQVVKSHAGVGFEEPAAAAPAQIAPLPAVPPRPRRPISADSSAFFAYTEALEEYARALESLVMALQKRGT